MKLHDCYTRLGQYGFMLVIEPLLEHLQQKRNNMALENQLHVRCKHLAHAGPKFPPPETLYRSAGGPLKKRPQRKR
jgi:hypothetical protein